MSSPGTAADRPDNLKGLRMCGALKNNSIISKKTIDSITLSIMAVGKFTMTLFLSLNDTVHDDFVSLPE